MQIEHPLLHSKESTPHEIIHAELVAFSRTVEALFETINLMNLIWTILPQRITCKLSEAFKQLVTNYNRTCRRIMVLTIDKAQWQRPQHQNFPTFRYCTPFQLFDIVHLAQDKGTRYYGKINSKLYPKDFGSHQGSHLPQCGHVRALYLSEIVGDINYGGCVIVQEVL